MNANAGILRCAQNDKLRMWVGMVVRRMREWGMSGIWRGMVWLGLGMMVVGGVGCTKIAPPTPLAELNAVQMHGHDVYQQHCAGCHYDRLNGPLHGPSLRGIFKKQYLESGAPANDERVMDAVMFGRQMMPAQGRFLTVQERADLLAYLHTL
jgi:mono/diheme cytochrome c family protein